MGQMHDGLYLLQDSSLSQATTSLADFLSKHNFRSLLVFVLLLFKIICFLFGIQD